MTESKQQPTALPWARFRDEMLTAREVRRKAAIKAVRRFADVNSTLGHRPRLKALVAARLQLREDLLSARFKFRRAVVHGVSQLVSSP